jgi:hypothetical protein
LHNSERTASYAVECYWPGVTRANLVEVASRAVREADALSREGKAVEYLGSMLFPGDEVVLCVFESSSQEAVKEANDRAGIPCERVVESVWLPWPGAGCDSGSSSDGAQAAIAGTRSRSESQEQA